MWGAWVGAVLYSSPLFFCGGLNCLSIFERYPTTNLLMPLENLILTGWLGLLLIPITGFLLGWGIHSLVRKLRK